MNYFKISVGIFITLAASRFIPHPPNFTSLLALSFYIPAVLGVRYIPILIVSFLITDLFIGLHSTILFTWGSILFICLMSKFFNKSIFFRITGVLVSAIIFYIITNFGVWTLGSYGYTFEGLVLCYYMALPFFGYSILSAIVFSAIIEIIYVIIINKIFKTKKKLI